MNRRIFVRFVPKKREVVEEVCLKNKTIALGRNSHKGCIWYEDKHFSKNVFQFSHVLLG